MSARVPPSLVPPGVAAGLPLEAARAALAWLCHGPDPVAIDGRAIRGLPARTVPVDELAGLLAAAGTRPQTRDAVWAYLVRRARAEGGTWTVVCVGAAVRDLQRTSDRLCHSRSHAAVDPGGRPRRHRRSPTRVEVESAVLAGFLAELAVTDVRRPGIEMRLIAAAYEAGRASRRALKAAPPPIFAPLTALPAVAGHPDFVLARAVAANAITAGEAALIGATRLEPQRLAEIAARRGHTLAQTRAARVRAERKLAAYLRSVHSPLDDPPSVLAPGLRRTSRREPDIPGRDQSRERSGSRSPGPIRSSRSPRPARGRPASDARPAVPGRSAAAGMTRPADAGRQRREPRS